MNLNNAFKQQNIMKLSAHILIPTSVFFGSHTEILERSLMGMDCTAMLKKIRYLKCRGNKIELAKEQLITGIIL